MFGKAGRWLATSSTYSCASPAFLCFHQALGHPQRYLLRLHHRSADCPPTRRRRSLGASPHLLVAAKSAPRLPPHQRRLVPVPVPVPTAPRRMLLSPWAREAPLATPARSLSPATWPLSGAGSRCRYHPTVRAAPPEPGTSGNLGASSIPAKEAAVAITLLLRQRQRQAGRSQNLHHRGLCHSQHCQPASVAMEAAVAMAACLAHPHPSPRLQPPSRQHMRSGAVAAPAS